MKRFVLCCVCLCVFLFSGCIIPFPHFKETCDSICGYVTTADPNVPIEGAAVKVRYSDEGRRNTITDENGYFSFSKKHRFYWGYLFGIAINYSLPYDCHPHGYAVLHINADGYDEKFASEGWIAHAERLNDPNDLDLSFHKMGCPVYTLNATSELN